MKRPLLHRLTLAGMLLVLLAACAPATATVLAPSAGIQNAASHSAESQPDYATVFPQESVNRLEITIDADQWAALQTEMTDQFGAFGTGSRDRGQAPQTTPSAGQGAQATPGANPDLPAQQGFDPPQNRPDAGWQPGMGAGNPGGLDFADTSYVRSTVAFNGETWQDVGFRYSGNSTLQRSWSSGTLKISFRLDFDEFEDENPAVKDQRFYGFKQISFKSNALDDSYLREKVTADIFREAGVVSSQTAFYEVYLDYGEGPRYFGVYTAVEVVDDTVIKTQFSDGSGNVYKPEGSGAAFVEGTFNAESFEKQTNAKAGDWSDIEALFAALHADTRQSDPAAWRAGLEKVFDVDAFLRWLAVDTIIQNWDTYGSMAHNYYLYTNPADGLLTWIPWDNNMALSGQGGGMERGGGPGGQPAGDVPDLPDPDALPGEGFRGRGGARELDLSGLGDAWPLISYLAADPVYRERYQQFLGETLATVWQPEALAERYQAYHDLIASYVEKEQPGFTQLASAERFDEGLTDLIAHARARSQVVAEYLKGE